MTARNGAASNSAKLASSVAATMLVAVLTACPPPPPKVYLGVTRGSSIQAALVREGNAYIVFVCPKEQVTVGWYCDKCDQFNVAPQPGKIVQNPGSLTFAATTDVTFTATGSNDGGSALSSVQVDVIDDSQTIGFSAQLVNTGGWPPHWSAFLPDWAYTPNAQVNRDHFSSVNAIPPSNSVWQLITPNNFAASIDVPWLPVDPPVPLPGSWRVGTMGLFSRENLPATINVELDPVCK